MRSIVGVARLIHPAPAAAVVALSAALGAILAAQAGGVPAWRLALTTLAVAGSQILTGALNDWADRDRDRIAQPSKPISSGLVTPTMALVVAGAGAAMQVAASLPLGPAPLVLGVAASASAVAYDLWLSRTPFSVVPYLVSFGLLPLWIATGVGVGVERVAAAPLIVGPFAAAAHLANALRDFDADALVGSRNLAQAIGRARAFRLAWGIAVGVGLVVGAALLIAGPVAPLSLSLGLVGLGAVVQGIAGPQRLWAGILVAAVCWTAAWALATA